jgi:hypothetical protein
MNETEKPYRHSKLHGNCVASCNECIVEESRNHGLAEGLRMAAEIILDHDENGDLKHLFYRVSAKAKEAEEAKGEQ